MRQGNTADHNNRSSGKYKSGLFAKKSQFRKQLNENLSIQIFFKRFDSASVSAFVEEYLSLKSLIYHKSYMSEDDSSSRLNVVDDCWQVLLEIQQKKLFKIQSVWRAGKVNLSGVEVTLDFLRLGDDIFNCALISAVTKDDINSYKQYICSEYYKKSDIFCSWQCYELMMHAGLYTGAIPGWYLYDDPDLGSVLNYPKNDVRGNVERQCLAVVAGKDNRIAYNVIENCSNDLPELTTSSLAVLYFAEKFDDKETFLLFQKYFRPESMVNSEINTEIQADLRGGSSLTRWLQTTSCQNGDQDHCSTPDQVIASLDDVFAGYKEFVESRLRFPHSVSNQIQVCDLESLKVYKRNVFLGSILLRSHQ